MASQQDSVTPAGSQVPGDVRKRQRLGGSPYAPQFDEISASNQIAPDAGLGYPQYPTAATGQRRKRRRRRRWYRRPIFVVPVFVALLAVLVGAIIMQRAASTVSVVQSVSTPPPVVSLQVDSDTALSGEPPSSDQSSVDPLIPNVQVDTEPAREAVAAAGGGDGRGGGVFGGIRDRASDVGNLGEGAAVAAGLQDEQLTPLNVLLMGVDARPGESIDVGVRPDVLAVLHLDPKSGGCRLLSVPRDSRVELPGYGKSKINHALAVGGIPYQMLVTSEFLELPLDRYALVDFAGVVTIVDEVGGVTVNVTEPFSFGGISFEAGPQTLDGEEALVYVRYRGGPDGDFGRIKRQQQVLRGLMSEASGMSPVAIVQNFIPMIRDHFRTDLSPAEIIALGEHFRGTCTQETLDVMSMDGSVATFDDPIFKMPLSFVVIDPAEARRKVEELTKA